MNHLGNFGRVNYEEHLWLWRICRLKKKVNGRRHIIITHIEPLAHVS